MELKRKRGRPRKVQAKQDGLVDLPPETAAAILANESQATPASSPTPTPQPDSADLVDRLTRIRERLFWLATVFATTLSHDIAYEADTYRRLFRDLGEQLKTIDQEAYDKLVLGHEAVLLADLEPVKHTIPLDVQKLVEMRWEITTKLRPPAPPRLPHIPDGLGEFV